MYQYTVIVGNVGRDPEMRYTQTGTAVCDFSVAVNRRWTDNAGETKEKTTWFRVTCWRALAETVNQYVHKGMRILVSGEVSATAWQTDDGQARAALEIRAQDVKFLGNRGNGGRQYENPTVPEALMDVPF